MELTLDQALQKGVEAHKAGQVQEADRYYTAILKANPEHPDANHNMGVLAVGVGKVEESLPFFKAAIDTNANIEQFWLSYIDAFIKLERIAEAKAVLDQAKSKGVNGERFDQLENRISVAEKTLAVNNSNSPEPPQDRVKILIDLYSKDQLQEALNQASHLLLDYPQSVTLYNIIGAANHGLGKLEDAIETYKKALTIKPDVAEVFNNMGNALKDQGKLDDAIQAYQKAISIKPDSVDAYYNLGNSLKEQVKLDEAIEAYTKALSIKPDYAEAHNNMGIAYKDQGKLKEALESYNNAIAINPNFAETHNNIGNALKGQGKFDEAIEAYNKALSIKPDYAEARNNLAIMLFEIRSYEKASKLFAMDDTIQNQNYLLKCFFELDNKSKFYNQLDYLIKRGENNCVIGSYSSRAKVRYGVNRQNPFCNDPFKYIRKIDLKKQCNFKKTFIENAANILSNDQVSHKSQGHLTNGFQTSGNIFTQVGSVTNLWQDIIQSELKNYKDHFCDSEEGLIQNWPSDYDLYGWLISMKNGGELSAHIHDSGWITGSIYINVPPKSKKDSGNLVVTTYDPKDGKGSTKDIKSIDVVTGSLCLFPSSLLHYTIPFESNENRIVLAFDVIPIK